MTDSISQKKASTFDRYALDLEKEAEGRAS
ncbi:MAG: hypothetical protein JWP87_494 [Labilithrix sp.]|jgi:hypothetical protein|nr:hypothetical protein [Labilithrix sp.]